MQKNEQNWNNRFGDVYKSLNNQQLMFKFTVNARPLQLKAAQHSIEQTAHDEYSLGKLACIFKHKPTHTRKG